MGRVGRFFLRLVVLNNFRKDVKRYVLEREGARTNGKRSDFPEVDWRACGMVGKARENGKLTVARQAGLYNPEIKGVLYPEEEEEGEWIRSRRKVERWWWVVKRRCSLGGRSSGGAKGNGGGRGGSSVYTGNRRTVRGRTTNFSYKI